MNRASERIKRVWHRSIFGLAACLLSAGRSKFRRLFRVKAPRVVRRACRPTPPERIAQIPPIGGRPEQRLAAKTKQADNAKTHVYFNASLLPIASLHQTLEIELVLTNLQKYSLSRVFFFLLSSFRSVKKVNAAHSPCSRNLP